MSAQPTTPFSARIQIVGQGAIAAPSPEQFIGPDDQAIPFLQDLKLSRLAGQLIERHEELALLDGLTVMYVWKATGGKSGGSAVLGKCQRMSGLARFLSGASDGVPVDFVVWLAADHLRFESAAFIERALYHEMSHIAIDEETGTPFVRSHDFSGFLQEFERFGAWRDDLRQVEAAVRQLPLIGGDV